MADLVKEKNILKTTTACLMYFCELLGSQIIFIASAESFYEDLEVHLYFILKFLGCFDLKKAEKNKFLIKTQFVKTDLH